MPASNAWLIGSLKASRSTRATAIPSALPAIAASKASTISGMSEVSEPVHWNDVPSSAEASSAPYCVGTKNGFVVTWLTNTKSHAGVSGKLPWAPPPPPPPPPVPPVVPPVPPVPPLATSSSSSSPQLRQQPRRGGDPHRPQHVAPRPSQSWTCPSDVPLCSQVVPIM